MNDSAERPDLDQTPRLSADRVCTVCGYALAGLPARSICPECGTPAAADAAPSLA